MFCNPSEAIAITRLEPRLDLFADRLGLDRVLLASWIVAWCGLSLAWDPDGWHARTCRLVGERLIDRG